MEETTNKADHKCSWCGADLHSARLMYIQVDDSKKKELVCATCADMYWEERAPVDNWWEWI